MHFVVAAYSFFPVPEPLQLRQELQALSEDLDLQGLAIVAPEGVNGTFATKSEEARQRLCDELRRLSQDPQMEFKFSAAQKAPFRDFQVKIRDEIVTLGEPGLVPATKKNFHLSPTEWNNTLKNEKDYVLIDTRNDYEYSIGTFKGAINPKTDKFSEFPEFLEKQSLPKDKKILIFCTGGIRCEKGILEFHRRGYENVHQLDGGILKYLEEHPNDQFEGECLVFDNRVAVDQTLNASSTYTWCPHCGLPAKNKIQCRKCGEEAQICDECTEASMHHHTCSKNCRNTLMRQTAQSQVNKPKR